MGILLIRLSSKILKHLNTSNHYSLLLSLSVSNKHTEDNRDSHMNKTFNIEMKFEANYYDTLIVIEMTSESLLLNNQILI